uniref:Uncharacterized protein n=1 Tax=Proboscia inermis TaxID=420281 RepID=A0A7S0CC27_9STRA|mmetsp:Transcript_39487/g.40018  ORF Transcript_39487/g.40018 Transcript_39487/m.40018 type:complete len:175 (+) Transcript_39487:95-619(+)
MTPAESTARRETRRYQRTASKSDTRPDTQTPTNDLLMMNSNPPSAVGGPPVMDGYGFEDDSFGCGSGVVTTPRNFTFERSLAEEVTHSAGGFEDGLVAAEAGEDVYSDSTPIHQRNRYEYSGTSNSGGASTNTLVDGERAVDGRNEGPPTTAAERQQAHRVRRHSSGHSIGSIE